MRGEGARGGDARGAGPGGATSAAPVVKPSRGHSSKDVLTLEWDFAVLGGSASDDAVLEQGRSVAKAKKQALPRSQAFAEVAGDDPRPLLVMRECGWCEGSDDALLSSRFENEKTILLSRWFHAVKLPNHVLEADHSFRNLFDGEAPPHLFMATRDGELVVGLDGQQSQSELWDAMDDVMEHVYDVDAARNVKKAYKLLDQLDMFDEDEDRLRERLDGEIEKKGPGTSRFKKLKKDLDEALMDRQRVREQLDGLLSAPVAGLGD